MQQIGIIGAGAGGTKILKTLLSTSNISVIGIADINFDSEGIRLAKQSGVFATDDFKQLLAKPGRKTIIDATGAPRVAAALHEAADSDVTIVNPDVAMLIMEIVNQREEVNRQLASESESLISAIEGGTRQLDALNSANEHTLRSTVEQVNDLSAASQEGQQLLKQTGQILELIRNVAGKTKMLGLNAAIEAARAGEHGRGFSVVANSIHELANSSATSANDVADTISKIHKALLAIADGVQKVVDEISNLESSQRSLGQEIHSSLEEMNKSAQALQILAQSVEQGSTVLHA